MFVDQRGQLPFPQVTPVRLPEVQSLLAQDYSDTATAPVLAAQIRQWYRPLLDTEPWPHLYFLNAGITGGLEYLAHRWPPGTIALAQGDYFWLRALGCAREVSAPEPVKVSYSSLPSALDGSTLTVTWPSESHILDCAYVGTALAPVRPPQNTDYVFLSFSKNLGVPELRAAVLLSRVPLEPLHTMQWRFGYLGLPVFHRICHVLDNLPITDLAARLTELQHRYLKRFPELELEPLPSAILARGTDTVRYKFYTRAGRVRVPLGQSITACLEAGLL